MNTPLPSLRSLLLPFALLPLLLLGFDAGVARLIGAHADREIFRSLESRARLLEDRVIPLVAPGASPEALQELLLDTGRRSHTRFTVIDREGKVLADSAENPQRLENHAGRPEIAEALEGRVASARRFSQTLRGDMLYCALPISVAGQAVAVLRAAEPAQDAPPVLATVRKALLVGGLGLGLAAAALMVRARLRVQRTVTTLREGAVRFAQGDFSRRIPSMEERGDCAGLADAMNRMAERLDARIRAAVQEKNQLEALFAGMAEGVIALDREERVFRINEASRRFLGLATGGGETAVGRDILEVIRHTGLRDLVRQALRERAPVERELALSMEAGTRFLQVHAVPLADAADAPGGALIVMHDVTGIRKLEIMRRDFVANVSHELKTPITSIKGFVETLLGGAMHDEEDGRRFLEIVERQAERLNVIVDDLLALSRLELDAEGGGIHLENVRVGDVLALAVQVCERKAADKAIRLVIDCPEELSASLNPPLIEQVLVNLVDNAVKYSGSGGQVLIKARKDTDAVLITVTDEGPGIAPEHLPRLFERFYRVDKARSRKMGGTGLGLAIVKHIVQAHGGQVHARSEVGRGSVFSIRLPGGGTEAGA